MKTFTSLNGALVLTAFAWSSELWRAMIDATQGFYSDAAAGSQLVLFTLGYAVILTGWAYAMYAASRGSRGSLIATFILNLIFWLAIPIGTLFFYCPGGCASATVNIVNWLNLILGLLAGLALAVAMRQKTPSLAVG